MAAGVFSWRARIATGIRIPRERGEIVGQAARVLAVSDLGAEGREQEGPSQELAAGDADTSGKRGRLSIGG